LVNCTRLEGSVTVNHENARCHFLPFVLGSAFVRTSLQPSARRRGVVPSAVAGAESSCTLTLLDKPHSSILIIAATYPAECIACRLACHLERNLPLPLSLYLADPRRAAKIYSRSFSRKLVLYPSTSAIHSVQPSCGIDL